MKKFFWVAGLFLLSNMVLAQDGLTPVIQGNGARLSRKIPFKQNRHAGPNNGSTRRVIPGLKANAPANGYYPLAQKTQVPGKGPLAKTAAGKGRGKRNSVIGNPKSNPQTFLKKLPTPGKGFSAYMKNMKTFPGYKNPPGAVPTTGPASLKYPTLYQSK